MRITLAIFRNFGNIPVSKERFIKFARGTLMLLSNTFKSFISTLLAPVVFLRFNVFLKDCLYNFVFYFFISGFSFIYINVNNF